MHAWHGGRKPRRPRIRQVPVPAGPARKRLAPIKTNPAGAAAYERHRSHGSRSGAREPVDRGANQEFFRVGHRHHKRHDGESGFGPARVRGDFVEWQRGGATTSTTSGASGKQVAVPWMLLRPSSTSGTAGVSGTTSSTRQPSFVFTAEATKLESAPAFDPNTDLTQPNWRQSVFSYFGVSRTPIRRDRGSGNSGRHQYLAARGPRVLRASAKLSSRTCFRTEPGSVRRCKFWVAEPESEGTGRSGLRLCDYDPSLSRSVWSAGAELAPAFAPRHPFPSKALPLRKRRQAGRTPYAARYRARNLRARGRHEGIDVHCLCSAESKAALTASEPGRQFDWLIGVPTGNSSSFW